MSDLIRFIELELANIELLWTAEGKGSYWWGVKIGLETVLNKAKNVTTVTDGNPEYQKSQQKRRGIPPA